MKNKVKKLFLCLMTLLFTVVFVACTSNNQVMGGEDVEPSYTELPNETNVVLEDNSIKNSEVQSHYFCGYRAYNTEFNLDSVKLCFYYGSRIDVSEHLYASSLNYILEFSDQTSSYSFDTDDIYDITSYNTIVIKKLTFEEFCLDDNNSVKPSEKPYGKIYQYHVEEITIPSQIFEYKSGIISFSLIEEYQSSDGEVQTGMGCGVSIFYKKENGRVTISNKSF